MSLVFAFAMYLPITCYYFHNICYNRTYHCSPCFPPSTPYFLFAFIRANEKCKLNTPTICYFYFPLWDYTFFKDYNKTKIMNQHTNITIGLNKETKVKLNSIIFDFDFKLQQNYLSTSVEFDYKYNIWMLCNTTCSFPRHYCTVH